MPLIRVVDRAGKYGFDYVTLDLPDSLITQDEITHFCRPSERRWVDVRIDPARGSGGGYQGPERRGKDNPLNSIGENGRPNGEARGADWLEVLWRQVEGNDALGQRPLTRS